jgi:TetR/AcrR family transcriptional regulator, transcriptional repressor for nem operon
MARPRAFDADAVLQAAEMVFRRDGYAGASLEDLTAATGLGKSSLYGAYRSKRGLYEAVLDRYIRRSTDAARRALEPPDAGLDALREYLLTIARGSSDGSPSCLLTGATVERDEHSEAVAGQINRTFDALSASLKAAVLQAQRHGEIDDSKDPAAVGRLLLATARGIEVLGHGGSSREQLEQTATTVLSALAPHAAPTKTDT